MVTNYEMKELDEYELNQLEQKCINCSILYWKNDSILLELKMMMSHLKDYRKSSILSSDNKLRYLNKEFFQSKIVECMISVNELVSKEKENKWQ